MMMMITDSAPSRIKHSSTGESWSSVVTETGRKMLEAAQVTTAIIH